MAETALHWAAAWNGRLSVVEFLVGAGADVDATDKGWLYGVAQLRRVMGSFGGG